MAYKSRHDKSGGYHSKKYIENNRSDEEKKYFPSEKENDLKTSEPEFDPVIDNGGSGSDDLPEYDSKSKKSKPLIIIIVILLTLTVLGAGAYAAYHFLTSPDVTPTEATVASTIAPATVDEATPQEATPQEATADPNESEDQKYTEAAAKYMETMSNDEKIYQMFIVKPETITGVDVATVAGDTTKEALAKYPVGGILFSSQNIEDTEQITEMISNMQSYSKTPLFTTVIEEGGTLSSCQEKLGTTELENMYSYKDRKESQAKINAKMISEAISKLGFNFDLAPVTDVWSNKDNTYIGERCYSDNFEDASKLIPAAVEGFHEGKMITTLKYFPGTGDAVLESEQSLPHISKTEEQLLNDELSPFKAGIAAGADTVTVGNVIADQIDADKPVSLSSKAVPELLRNKLSYTGIVMSDSIQSSALTQTYSTDDIVKGMINDATINILVDPGNIDEYYTAVNSAVTNGEIKQSAIDESVTKIIALKIKYGIIKTD